MSQFNKTLNMFLIIILGGLGILFLVFGTPVIIGVIEALTQ